MSTQFFRTRWSDRVPPALVVAWLLVPGSTLAQDPAAGVDETPPGTAQMPEALRAPAHDPFSSGLTLQGHKLRGLTAEVAGLIMGGDPGGGEIAFEPLATPLPGSGDKSYVPLFIEIDGPTFLESNQSGTARVEVYAYALDADQAIAGFLAEVFAVNVQELGEAVWQGGIKYYGHLDLPPGDYRLRVLIRNYHSKAAAIRELTLRVPDFGALQQPFVLSPLFPTPRGRDSWLPVREWEGPGDYPFVIEDQALSPAVRPVLVAGRRQQAHLFAYGLPAGQSQGRVELLQRGETITSAALEISSRLAPDSANGPEKLEIHFQPPRVDPGIYALRVQLAGAMSATTPVVLLRPETRDRGLVWTDLRGQLDATPRPAAREKQEPTEARPDAETEVSQAAKREEERRIQRLVSRYRGALAAVGRGQHSTARSALLDLETGVLTDGSLQALQTAQLLVAEQLASRDIESIIPMLVLHDDLYLAYRQRRLYSLGLNARTMIELLAELYAERGGTRGSRIVAARALASLGGHLQEANLPSSSRRLYRRALEHDASSKAALLGLATSFERYGEYSHAIDLLEDLVAAHPRFGEGLLRLAINLDRIGVQARCRELLAEVVEVDAPGWVRSLAYQRLARILLETGDLEQAALLLEKCLEEISGQHGAVYLLAHIYDRRREAYKALELLQTIAPAGAKEDSPRKRYDSWPKGLLDSIRDELAEAARVRQPLVAEILAGSEPTEMR